MPVVTVQLQTMIFTVIYGLNCKTFELQKDPLYGIIIYDIYCFKVQTFSLFYSSSVWGWKTFIPPPLFLYCTAEIFKTSPFIYSIYLKIIHIFSVENSDLMMYFITV